LAFPSGPFPNEFRDRAFGKPDKPFVVVLLFTLFLVGGLTFIMSLRKPPAVDKKHIVKIQNRYAKLVLDAFEIEKRKKMKKEVKPPSEALKKTAQVPELKKEEPEVEKQKEEIKIEIPKVIERKVKKYEIRKEKIEIAELEKEIKIETLPDLPDILDKKSKRYGERQDSDEIGLDPDLDKGFNLADQGPHIDVSRSSRYGSGGNRGSGGLDYEEDETSTLQSKEPQIDTRTVKRYKSKRGASKDSGTGSLVADMNDRKVVLAKKAPQTKVLVKKRYGRESYKRRASREKESASIAMKEKGAILKKEGKMASLPERANIQNLEACVDPNEEKMLKKKIVTHVGDAATCSDKWGSYAYLGREMFSTLEVRFVSSGKRRYNRCEALNRALQCLINKNKR